MNFQPKATIVFLFFLSSINEAATWKEFAEPLMLPKSQTGPFVFEIDIQWQLTMSFSDEHEKITMIDYSVDEQRWYQRNMDPLMSCSLQESVTNMSKLQDVIQLHGLHQRIMTINGESPAKPIVVPFGAEVIMRVHNNLITEGISIHVHGMDKRNAWFTDGVPFLQQCPIPAGAQYSYRFIADTPGTLWYHGHYGTERGEGVLGAFIVIKEDERVTNIKKDRVLPSRQYVVLLQDRPMTSTSSNWNNQEWGAVKWMKNYEDRSNCYSPTRLYDGSNVGGAVPISAITVNDKGWHNQTELKTVPESLPLEKFRIKPGEQVLLRIIHGGLAQALMVAIEGHRMMVVAADGQPVKPLIVDMIVLFSGERYDVLVEGKATPERKVFFITIETQEHYDWSWKKIDPFFGAAQLIYESPDAVDTKTVLDYKHLSCSFENRCSVLNCPFTAFPKEFPYTEKPQLMVECGGGMPLLFIDSNPNKQNNGFAVSNDNGYQEHFLNIHFDDFVNQWTYLRPKGIPYYYHGREKEIATMCDPSNCPPNSKTDCHCFFHINVTLNNVVQLTIYNMGEGSERGVGFSHPFHIHGHHFYLLKMGFATYNKTTNTIMGTNADLPCNAENLRNAKCNDLKWTNSTWMNGRVDGTNSIDPSFRDTVVVPAGGYIVVRFLADHAGWFFAHCHTMDHEMDGMAFALRVGEHDQMPPPPDNFPHLCGVFEQPPLPVRQRRAEKEPKIILI